MIQSGFHFHLYGVDDMLTWDHGGGFSLDRLAKLLPPPRIHRHRYHGVFAPNAPLRSLVTERAHQDNALAAQNSVPEPPDSPLQDPVPSVANSPEPQPPNTVSSRPSPCAALS